MTSFDQFCASVRQLCVSYPKQLTQPIKSMAYAILRQLRKFVFASVCFCCRFVQLNQWLTQSASVRQLPYIYKYITGALTCAEFIYIYWLAAAQPLAKQNFATRWRGVRICAKPARRARWQQ